ncbi:SLATT domain-containing protein [Vibrio neptunius]|uniref:SLATT domain-containing protein n=1 Tax=Vibrio neptunius TaxID=170651 RepID=UPI0006972436|nr:SLATT domain-containing protein [Vibrio neptunius]
MNQSNQTPTVSFLIQEIDKSIKVLKPKVKKQKNRASLFTGLSVALGALVTLTLGIDATGWEATQKNSALILGALLTIVNGWTAVFDHKKLWIRQKSTLLDLYHLKNQVNYIVATSGQAESEAVDEIFEQYQDIWERDGNEWRSIIYKTASKKQPEMPNVKDQQ